jgi:hypothetical protein
MLFPRRAAATTLRLSVPMAEAVAFRFSSSQSGGGGQQQQPERVLLEVQAGQDLQVYEARVTLVARLRGLRGVMYRWRVAAFVVATVGFWVGEMVVLGAAVVLVLGWDLGGLLGDEEDEEGSEEGGSDGGGYYGGEGKGRLVKAEFASSSSASAGGFGKGAVKKEEEEGDSEGELSKVPEFDPGESTEADDEAESGTGKEKGKGKGVVGEEGSDTEDVGVGTSYGGQGGREGARRRNISR